MNNRSNLGDASRGLSTVKIPEDIAAAFAVSPTTLPGAALARRLEEDAARLRKADLSALMRETDAMIDRMTGRGLPKPDDRSSTDSPDADLPQVASGGSYL